MNASSNALGATNILDVLKRTYATQKQPHEAELVTLKEDRREKESALMTISQKIFGTVQIHDPRPSKERLVLMIIAQVAAVLLVAYGEWPFNSVSFQVLGSLSNQQCSYVALAIGAVMGFLAFGTGYSFKKGWVTGSGKWWGLGLILTLVSIGGIYTLSVMRAEYLRQNAEDGTTMLNPATQTALTYMIFLGGVMVEFFCSRVHEFPEDFSAYCKTYAEYEKILAKIKAAEDAIDSLNAQLHSELGKESQLIVARTKMELSRREEVPSVPAIAREQETMGETLSAILEDETSRTIIRGHDTPFYALYKNWLEAGQRIEEELNRKEKDPNGLESWNVKALIKKQQEMLIALDTLVLLEPPTRRNEWSLSKDIFSHLVNRVENETK